MQVVRLNLATLGVEEVPCVVCGEKEFTTLANTDRYRMGIRTCQCRTCGLILTNPMPSEQGLASFYRDHYRAFYRKVESPSPNHVTEYGLDERAQRTSAYLAGNGLVKDAASILDVGCAEGSLLKAVGARVQSARLVGIEPNPKFAQYARETSGAVVYPDLHDVESLGVKFDLVIINHVLEHIRQPAGFLRRINRILSPRGKIYIDVPDAARYRSLDDLHLAHLYHFTVASLRNVVAQAGLGTVVVEKHDPYRHPLSIRGVFQPVDQPDHRVHDTEAARAKSRIRRISLLAPAFEFRRSRVGKALLDRPIELLRVIRGSRA